MRILIYTDVHLCQDSSIIRGRGEKYSKRLENVIQSVSWAEYLAVEKECQAIVCLGDFFDKSSLNVEELSAITEIDWNKSLPHYFLVGNHEVNSRDISHNSLRVLSLQSNFYVIDSPSFIEHLDTRICFLPYIYEDDRKSLKEYLTAHSPSRRTLILSHNDIAGIQMGQYLSEAGFKIDDIESNCDLFINGHLHNGQKISDKIINLGNLTGQNFSEDALKYSHNAMVLDVDTLQYELIENPYAYNFYKLDFTERSDIDYINGIQLKHNAVVTVRVNEGQDSTCIKARFLPDYVNDLFPKNRLVVAGRLILKPVQSSVEDIEDRLIELNSINHLDEFKQYILNSLGNTNIITSELEEVCK